MSVSPLGHRVSKAKAIVSKRLLDILPPWTKDLVVTVGSSWLLVRRRSGVYRAALQQQHEWMTKNRSELLEVQSRRTDEIVRRAVQHSAYYGRKYAGYDIAEVSSLPVLEKEELQQHIDEIVIGNKDRLVKSFTGGTTGKGIVVFNDIANHQERFAVLDVFWAMHGYRVGRSRAAWFSGRALVWENDVVKRRFWRTNWLYRIRYYSTFHMAPENLQAYVEDLNRFKPEFINGFPSAISEVARFVEARRIPLEFQVRAVFVTSEILGSEQRELIERVFGCKVRNQYASSEGAPFINECRQGNLHMDVTTGLFEVIDDEGKPSREGEVLVTSFTTRETPIIRYRIGDRIKLADQASCPCGWDTPLVAAIEGRQSDFIEVPGRGRIFTSQIGDCVKDVTSVICFQVEVLDGRLQAYLVAERPVFEQAHKDLFLKKVHERVGELPVDLHFVPSIPRSPSGKHSVVRSR